MSDTVTPVVLVTAGGLAREVAAVIGALDHFDLIGVVDDEPATWGSMCGPALVLGPFSALDRHPDSRIVMCAGRGRDRARLRRRLVDSGVDPSRFQTVVDPAARLAPDVVVGSGAVVLAGCVFTAGVRVGAGCVVMPNVTLTHDVVLEDDATVCAGVSIGGSAVVGSEAYLGMGVTVRQRVRIGRRSTVGMGAAVLSDVPDDETWVGVPARRVATRMEVG